MGEKRQTRAAYMRPYVKARRHARRARLIGMLGGCCVRCGATENLHFDHIDPSTKRFAIGSDLSRAWDVLVAEALKTQLLCPPCHVEKGREDRPEVPHGLYRYEYYHCRCDVCKAANSVASARKRQLCAERQLAESVGKPWGDQDSSEQKSWSELPRCDSNTQPAG